MRRRKIGVGVIGLGFMGRTHIEAFSSIEECEVVAVADQDESRLLGLPPEGGNLGGQSKGRIFDPDSTATFKNPADLLSCDGIDLVSITTPTPTHVELAIAAIESGRHVLVEKPVDLQISKIALIAEAARKRGVLAMPAHCMRSWPAWSWMRERVINRTFGDVVSARFLRTGAAPNWNGDFYLDDSKSGGAMVDLHIHDADYILHCLGMPSVVVSNGTRRRIRTEYRFEGGLVVEAEGGWLEASDAPFTMKAEIECVEATMSFDLARNPEVQVKHADGAITNHPEASIGGTGYEVQARRFIDAVHSGARVPPVTMEDAAKTARLLDCEIDSMVGGGIPIKI